MNIPVIVCGCAWALIAAGCASSPESPEGSGLTPTGRNEASYRDVNGDDPVGPGAAGQPTPSTNSLERIYHEPGE